MSQSNKFEHSAHPKREFLSPPDHRMQDGAAIKRVTDFDVSKKLVWEEFCSYFNQMPERIYPKDSIIYMSESSSPEHFYILKKGRVNMYRVSRNGKPLIVKQFTSGFLGLRCLFGKISQANYLRVVEDCTVCIVTKDQGLAFLRQRPDLLIRLLGTLYFELDQKEENYIQAVYLPANVRLAHFLLGAADLESDTLANFSHEEIANMIGAARQTVTIKLNQMQKKGVISIKKKFIHITDRQTLEQMIN
jgi:CRP/FNR family transcriptional regulator, anaerobic regulatory protein